MRSSFTSTLLEDQQKASSDRWQHTAKHVPTEPDTNTCVQRVEEMVLHNHAAFAQQAAVYQLAGQSVQTVPSQLQLSELHQLAHALRQHGERVVPQTQRLELGASEQRLRQHLQLVGVDGQVLQIVEETHIRGEHGDGVVAHVQVPQFR
ncbi:hypothetical protein EYF80_019909 [Liparis tanakae]|uniref:Uncharacterized protein n=1 Tax=Liparis tanakae TaxID=230148 RepID=A0A4Z2HW78_9TELE|nr:hypothetical protein EYF80_019909 [Liparis tanakae]